MFYETTIQRICDGGGAIDSSGRKLSFMGNLPVSEGDSVWTDGNVIFGHVKTENTPLIPISQIKIPVLGAEGLRGYIRQYGNYKEYDIVQDGWIANTDKLFEHGETEYNGKKVIDAEISDEGDLYIATEGFYSCNQAKIYKNHLYRRLFARTSGHPEQAGGAPLALTHAVNYEAISYEGEEVTLGSGITDTDIAISYEGEKITVAAENEKNDSVVFYKNAQMFDTLNLKPYAELATLKAMELKEEIMSRSNKEENAINYTKQPDPPVDFVASSYARISSVKIDKSGDWEAIITASAYGYCFPYLSLDGSIFADSFPNGEDKIFSSDLEECMYNFEYVVYRMNEFSELAIEKYPAFTGTKKVDGEYTAEYKQYILDKVQYYIPLARFRYHMWFPQMFNVFLVYKLRNGLIENIIQSSYGGGYPIELSNSEWNEKSYISSRLAYAFVLNEEEKKSYTFPLDALYYYRAEGLKLKEIYAMEDNKKIATINQNINSNLHEDHYEAIVGFPLETYITIDNTAQSLADKYSNGNIDHIWGRQIFKVRLRYKYITPENEEEVYDLYPKKEKYSYLSAWLQKGDEEDVQLHHALNFNHNFSKLKGESYLIGLHNGKLLKVTGDNVEVLGDKLKNFRLRELKNIAKAKEQLQ